MSLRAYKLTPVDTWFFRDGRPYNQGDSYQSDIKSLFPPFATTAVGAIRASFARSLRLGWNGKGDWPYEIKQKLGDGPKLDPLKFRGPYLVREHNGTSEVLYPVPLHLLGKSSETDKDRWEQLTILRPGKGIDCDIGEQVRLPYSKNAEGLKSLYGSYLTSTDLAKVLIDVDLGNIHPIRRKDLWEFEFSIGIERKSETRSVVEGALYSISKVRLKPGVSLAVEIDGLDDDVELESTFPFGGEGRLAQAERINEIREVPKLPALDSCADGKIRFTVTHLTPAHFNRIWPGPGGELPGLVGSRVVSACMERPLWIGGWDTVNKRPLPLKPYLPGGSTWFCEADGSLADKMINGRGQRIGEYCEFGFGEIAVGLWNDIR